MAGEEGGSEGMNGWEHIPLKGVSGEEHRQADFYLRYLSIFATHIPSFIPPVVPVLSCKTNFLAPLEPNQALCTAKTV